MIQGGGMESGLREKSTRAPIKNEANNGLSNKVGTIAMLVRWNHILQALSSSST